MSEPDWKERAAARLKKHQARQEEKLHAGKPDSFIEFFALEARRVGVRVVALRQDRKLVQLLLEVYEPEELEALIREAMQRKEKVFQGRDGFRVSWSMLYAQHQEIWEHIERAKRREKTRERVKRSTEQEAEQTAIPEHLLEDMPDIFKEAYAKATQEEARQEDTRKST